MNSAPGASFWLLELVLELRRPLHHRAELEHPELTLADSHPQVAIQHRPARIEPDGERDQEPEREANDDDDEADDEIERLLHDPVRPGEHRRAQLEERHPLAGNVLAALQQQLGRLRCDPHFHAGAMRRLDDLQHGRLFEVALVEDHLVGPGQRDALRQFLLAVGRQDVDELVRDPGPLPRQHAPKRRRTLTTAEEERPFASVEQPLHSSVNES